MTISKQNGYYLSEPEKYEDFHAGLKIEYYTYVAYFFISDTKVYLAVKENIKSFSKKDFIPDGMEIEYSISDKIIDFHYDRGSQFEYHRIFQIQDNHTIIDKRSIKYHWTPFPTETEKNNKPPATKIDS